MTGIEVAAAAALGWLFNKARRVGGRLDAEVDRIEDAGVRRLHEVVSSALGETPAMAQLQQEAAEGRTEPSERTRLLFVRTLAEQVRQDPAFGEELRAALAELLPAEPAPAASASAAPPDDAPAAAAQDNSVRVDNNNGGVVARDITNFTFTPPRPVPPQG